MRRRLDIGIFSSQSHAKIELYIAVYLMYIEQKNTKRRKQKKGGGDGEPNLTPANTKTIYSNIYNSYTDVRV